MYILGSHLVDLIVYMMGEPKKATSFLRHTGLDGVDFVDNNLAVLEYTDGGFDLTDKAENHIESKKGYRCVLTVSDGQVVYRN